MITLETAQSWIGKEACVHWDDDGSFGHDGGMLGLVDKIETDADGSTWLVVDYGFGADLRFITAIHEPEECVTK